MTAPKKNWIWSWYFLWIQLKVDCYLQSRKREKGVLFSNTPQHKAVGTHTGARSWVFMQVDACGCTHMGIHTKLCTHLCQAGALCKRKGCMVGVWCG